MYANNVALLLLFLLQHSTRSTMTFQLTDLRDGWVSLTTLVWFQSYLPDRQFLSAWVFMYQRLAVLNMVFRKESFLAHICFHYICSQLETLLTFTRLITIFMLTTHNCKAVPRQMTPMHCMDINVWTKSFERSTRKT